MEFVLKPMSDLHQFRSEKSMNDCSHEYKGSKQIECIALNPVAELRENTGYLIIAESDAPGFCSPCRAAFLPRRVPQLAVRSIVLRSWSVFGPMIMVFVIEVSLRLTVAGPRSLER